MICTSIILSRCRDLNPGPLPYQGSALPLSYIGNRAENGTQTRDPQLGRLMLYQLSYFRIFIFYMWAVMDSNHRRRKSAELQSAPFGHSGNCPFFLISKSTLAFFEPLVGFEPTTPRLQITCSGQLS